MALTVSQEPQPYTPAYNAQTFRALSDQIAVTDFKYIVTVQVNGDTVFTYNILQRPDGYCIYDPIEIVKNYITRDYFNPLPFSNYNLAPGKAATVEVNIKEYYTGAIQSTYTHNYTVWDACLKEEDFLTYYYEDYLGTSSNILPLSDITNVEPHLSTLNGDSFLHFFRKSATQIEVNVYDENGSTVATDNIAIDTSNNLIHYFKYGVKTVLDLGFTPLDNWSIEIIISNSTPTILYTEVKTFKSICTKYDKYGVFYLTREGKMDYMDFNFISQNTINKKTNDVRLNPNKNGASSYGRNLWDAERFIVSTQTTKQVLLNSDWITQNQSEQLQELFDSPVVLLKDYSANKYYSVIITDTNYQIKKKANDKLFNYSLTVEYGTQETRQRGL